MAKWIKRTLLVALAVLVVGGLIYALRPLPVPVDTAVLGNGPLEVTVDEEGVTRIREVYMVSAPIAGKVLRAPREVGDDAVAGETVVAVIQPGDPSFLDVRTRRELTAAVAASVAAVALAEAQVRRASSELEFAKTELTRAQKLFVTRTISQQSLDKARLEVDTRKAAVASEIATLELRKRELESARARLIGPENPGVAIDDPEQCCVTVRAPASGKVLKVLKESEQRVQAGEPLIEVGDPHDLEIVVELLSSDAVKVSPEAQAHIENWGGGETLTARVNHIEPAGFMKVSALGIEEQRVNVVLDFKDAPEKWRNLGHDFRIFARIVVWKRDDVLRVPLSALFRQGNEWAVFIVVDGLAKLTTVEIGQRNSDFAEVRAKLEAGQRVVLHPSDRVADEVRVSERGSP